MDRKEYTRIQIKSSAWTRRHPENMALARDSINEFLTFVPTDHSVLEIGAGDGYSLDLLEGKGYQKLMGCDINLAKLNVAKTYEHIVSVQDVHDLGFADQAFDAVYCAHTLEHTHNGYRAVKEIYRILRPGGIVFIIVPDHFRYYGDTFVESQEVIGLRERSMDFFEELMYKRTGMRSLIQRNQFPFTMKLLLWVLLDANFEVQWVSRIARNGPELWAAAMRHENSRNGVNPIRARNWGEASFGGKLWLNIKKPIGYLRRIIFPG